MMTEVDVIRQFREHHFMREFVDIRKWPDEVIERALLIATVDVCGQKWEKNPDYKREGLFLHAAGTLKLWYPTTRGASDPAQISSAAAPDNEYQRRFKLLQKRVYGPYVARCV